MKATQIEMTGTLQPDGTLVLDAKPELPPGKVRIVVQAIPETGPEPASEGWWPYMQRVRAEREAAGYHFMDEGEMTQHLEWLRDDDDRIDRIHREIEQERRKPESQ